MRRTVKQAMTSEKDIFGFRPADLLGIVIMIIPVIISIRFNQVIPGQKFLFLEIKPGEVNNIRPGLISTMLAVAFYASLMLRYEGIFRANNVIDIFVTIVRMFLNCWVIAAFITLVIPTTIPKDAAFPSILFYNRESTLLLIALVLSWLGMKTIAGYSWILFIIAAWKHLLRVDAAMEMGGAIFVMTFAISLFLQIMNYVDIRDFWGEFREKALSRTSGVKTEINEAVDDASTKAQVLGRVVEENVSAYTGVKLSAASREATPSSGVKIDLESLDLNHDGVVDVKDFLILQEKEASKE